MTVFASVLERAWTIGLERVGARGIRVERGCGRLYEKLGFVTEGMERQACKLDGIYDDTVVMALSRTAN